MSEITEFVSLEALEFDTDSILPEVVLLVSLLLRAPAEFVMTLSASPEYKSTERQRRNVWMEPLIPNLLRGKRELFYTKFLPQNFLLPDVCISCLTVYGLTVAGRVRVHCPNCSTQYTTEEVHNIWGVCGWLQLREELSVFWIPTQLQEILLCQLLYKHHSTQGDPTWVLILPQM